MDTRLPLRKRDRVPVSSEGRAGSQTRVAEWLVVTGTVILLLAYAAVGLRTAGGRALAKVSGIDPVAYFGVSHSMLFDRDFDLTNQYRNIEPVHDMWTDIRPETGKPASAWAIGYSIVSMPFLAAGTAVDSLAGNRADGYGRYALLFYSLTNIVLTGLGLLLLLGILRRAGRLYGLSGSRLEWTVIFVVGATLLGTNVGYYAFAPMGHATTFFAFALFFALWFARRDSVRTRDWFLLGLAGGFLAISRWQEALFLLVPFAYGWTERGAWRDRWLWLRRSAAFGAGVFLCAVPQMLEWKVIFGSYIVSPQTRIDPEFFVFPPPYALHVLFSTRNGWFVWTPLAFIGIVGLLRFGRKLPRFVVPVLAVLVCQVLLIGSARYTWSGMDSFSARYLTSSAVLVALGCMALLSAGSLAARWAVSGLMGVCCVFTILFAVQMRLDLTPRDGYLTAAELFTDKLRIPEVQARKGQARVAAAALESGDAERAASLLENIPNAEQDATVQRLLVRCYRVLGRSGDAQLAQQRLNAIEASRLP